MNQVTIPATVTSLFPTEIYRTDLDVPQFAEFLDTLDDTCRAMADDDEPGQQWSRQAGYLGYTSYGSILELPKYAPVFAQLKQLIDAHVAAFAERLEYDLGNRKLTMANMWINILEPMGMHAGHIHPLGVISGTFYVAIPDGAGALKYEDPRLGLMMHAPTRRHNARQDHQVFVPMIPKRGTLLLWESWLRHEVPINMAEDVRISVSFNYD